MIDKIKPLVSALWKTSKTASLKEEREAICQMLFFIFKSEMILININIIKIFLNSTKYVCFIAFINSAKYMKYPLNNVIL